MLGPERIDDTDFLPGFGQEEGQRLPVGARGFHAEVAARHGRVALHPAQELGKARRAIVELAEKRLAALWVQTHVQGAFGHVDADPRPRCYVVPVSVFLPLNLASAGCLPA